MGVFKVAALLLLVCALLSPGTTSLSLALPVERDVP